VRGERAIPGVVLDPQGRVVDYDIAAQCHAVMRNVRAVLDAAGSS
jgi:2-aminomuconate deaminase